MLSVGTIVHEDETKRLKSLRQYDILDTLPDPAFDEIAGLAASVCNAPYAFIGFIDWSRVWFKSTIGFSGRQMDRAGSPCQFLTLDAKPTLISDATEDQRFRTHGIALTSDVHCRSYAAAPLLSPSGSILGTLAVCSTEAHAFNRRSLESLQVLARQVVTRLELYAKGSELEQIIRSRQQVEQVLTVERNFVSAVLNTISALVLVLDTTGRIVRFNKASESISGRSSDNLVGSSFTRELFPPEESPSAVRLFESALSGEPNQSSEIVWQSESGERRHIAWTATALTNAEDEVSFVIMTGVDVTEKREAENSLRSSEERYRQLVESSHGIICTHDLEGILLSINSHAAVILGYQPQEMIGTPLRNYIDPEHLSDYEEYFRAVKQEPDRDHQGSFYLRTRDGRICIVAYRNRLLQLPGTAPFVLSHGIDITEQTQAEEELHALTRQHESILESVGDGIWGMDMQGRLTFVNRGGASMFGYSPEELQGQEMHSLIHHSYADGTPYPKENCPILGSLKRETPVRIDNDVFWRKDGKSFPVEYVACPLVNGGRVEGIVVAFEDVTERRRLDRMKDEFISTVSHELRTPLTALRGALGLIAGGVLEKHPEKIPQMLDIAIGNCDRLVRLVNDIVDFEWIDSGHLPLHKRAWNAIDLLRQAMDLDRSTAARAGISFRIDAQPVDAWVDGDRILQTLGNLIRNAIKFSEKGGEVRLVVFSSGEKEVTFEVQDQGRGIPPEKLDMIFDRFQQGDASDSRSSGGTGLGLALCRSIVQQHGGRIWARNNPIQGSTFSFTVEKYLPPEDSQSDSDGSDSDDSGSPAAGGSVPVV